MRKPRANNSPHPRVGDKAATISLHFPQNPPTRVRFRSLAMDDDLDAASASPPSPRPASRPRPLAKASPAPPAISPPALEETKLTPEERARESAKRKGWRHARGEAAAAVAIVVITQHEDVVVRVASAMREALLYLGLNPGQHGLVNTTVVTTSTGSFVFPRMVSVVALPMPAPASIDLNATPVADGLSSGGQGNTRKRCDAAAPHGAIAAGYDPKETQSQDDRGSFMPSTYDQAGMQAAFMQDQVVLYLDGFPLDHVFLDDYILEGEDELYIDGEPLFEDELANQAAGVKSKRKRKWKKAYTVAKDRLLCEC
ncbi:DNA repair protein rhp54 [Hordeum vulgare]|nr:DNA repair protein rhp54 [Hordeum vulgare]